MFIRKKKNRSGTVSVVVVDKSYGKFKELTTIGVAKDEEEASNLARKAHVWIEKYKGQLTIDFDETDKALREAKATISRVERTLQNMPQTILPVFRTGHPFSN